MCSLQDRVLVGYGATMSWDYGVGLPSARFGSGGGRRHGLRLSAVDGPVVRQWSEVMNEWVSLGGFGIRRGPWRISPLCGLEHGALIEACCVCWGRLNPLIFWAGSSWANAVTRRPVWLRGPNGAGPAMNPPFCVTDRIRTAGKEPPRSSPVSVTSLDTKIRTMQS